MPQPMKALAMLGAVRQTLIILKRHFPLLLTISLFFLVPLQLAFVFLAHTLSPSWGPTLTPEQREACWAAAPAIGNLLLAFRVLLLVFALPMAHAAVIWGLAHQYLSRPVAAWKSVKSAVRILVPLILTNLLASLICVSGYGLFLFGGVLVGWGPTLKVRWFGDFLMRAVPILWILPTFCYVFASYVAMIEGKYGLSALARSAALIMREMGKVFVLGLFLWFVMDELGMAGGDIPRPILSDLLRVVMWTILFIISAAGSAVIYFSARCKLKRFDETALADQLEKRFTQSRVTSAH